MTTEHEQLKDASGVREAAAAVVHGVYRLVKACAFHLDANNDAVTSLTTSGEAAIREFCTRANVEAVTITFLGDAVFVNRQILKSSRDTHALATALGDLLAACDVTEVTFRGDAGREAIASFARLLADVQRDHSLAATLAAGGIPGIAVGKAKFAMGGRARNETPAMRAARVYAISLMTLQGVFADLRAGKHELPRKVKRVAQRLVAYADEDARLIVALAAAGSGSADPAIVSLAGAIFAVGMAKQLTTNRALLTNAAMAALLCDVGRAALAGGGSGPPRTLNEDELDRVPLQAVVTLTAIGRLHAASRARAALIYEVWSQRRAHRIGPAYRGKRQTTLLARIIGVAHSFAELRASGMEGMLTVDDALQVLSNRAADGTERALVKLLVGALGIYPAGTLVELNTGEMAVVMGTPAMPVDYVRPPVKILYDANATLLDAPFDVDLAASRGSSETPRFVRRSIDADDRQAKAMRSFVLAAVAAKRRGALDVSLDAPPSSGDRRDSRDGLALSPLAITASVPPAPRLPAVTGPPPRVPATTSAPPKLPPQGSLPPARAGSIAAPPLRAGSMAPPQQRATVAPPSSARAAPSTPVSPRVPIVVSALPPPPAAVRPSIGPPPLPSALPPSAPAPSSGGAPLHAEGSSRRPPPAALAEPSRRPSLGPIVPRTDSSPPPSTEEVQVSRPPARSMAPSARPRESVPSPTLESARASGAPAELEEVSPVAEAGSAQSPPLAARRIMKDKSDPAPKPESEPPAELTREVHWDSYKEVIRRASIPPPPEVDPEPSLELNMIVDLGELEPVAELEPVIDLGELVPDDEIIPVEDLEVAPDLSRRDSLLAAFLEDAPLDSEPPPKPDPK